VDAASAASQFAIRDSSIRRFVDSSIRDSSIRRFVGSSIRRFAIRDS
jgi:hypothetical protein